MTLLCETALDQYFREHIKRKAAAPIRVEYAIEALLDFFTGVDISDVDIPMCRDYREHRDTVADATVRRELNVLVAAANHAVRWRRLKGQMPSIELPAESAPRKVWLYKDELATFLNTASELDRRVFRFAQLAYHTASRKRAIEGLTWDRIDLKTRRINLQDPELPLTRKRCPIVAISPAMCEELETMKLKATNRFVLATNENIAAAFERVATKAGLADLKTQGMRQEGRLTPHILRHSRATHLLQDGKNPWVVANLLGDSLPTVLRVYGHACPDYMADAVS